MRLVPALASRPHFAGYTYSKACRYHVMLVVRSGGSTHFGDATIKVT